MSTSRHPRNVGVRRINTHQNTKNVRLLSAMNATCMTNAPRSASDALRFVAMSARANLSVFPVRVTEHLPLHELSAVHRQSCRRTTKGPLDDERHDAAPDSQVANQD